MSKSPGIPKCNYTTIPNIIIDSMPSFEAVEFAVIIAICRKTFGWQHVRETLTVPQIKKMTGFSRRAIMDAIQSLISSGWITRTDRFEYEILVSEDGCATSAQAIPAGATSAPSEATSAQGGVQPVHSEEPPHINIKESTKDTPKETTPSAKPPEKLPNPEHSKFIKGWHERYKEFFKRNYVLDKKELRQLSQFLATTKQTADELIQIAELAWNKTSFWCTKAVTINTFLGRFNEIQDEIDRPQKTMFGRREIAPDHQSGF